MRIILSTIFIVLFLQANAFADQVKPGGKWFPRQNYTYIAEHEPALVAAKKWIQSEGYETKYDFIYKIEVKNEYYYVFIEYVMDYSEKNDPMFAAGGHVSLNVSKSGKIIDVSFGT